MNKKTLLLFDLDGTITDSAPGITKSAAYALEKYGIQVKDPASLTFFVGPPLEYTFETRYRFSKKKALEAVSYFREYYRRSGWNDCSLYPDTKSTLENLKKRGYRIALASSKNEPMCVQILSHFGLISLFDGVYGAEADGPRRDKPAVLSYALDSNPNIPREEAILIGDTEFDARGAAEVGIDCLGVSYGCGDPEAMKRIGVVGMAGSMKRVEAFFP
ncbi:MAG: HAD hydrolase-like protein [Lachnospiraceae bacterium]|nr:HAD hydrolase-like protein [Lachnospiraceae bacterium]